MTTQNQNHEQNRPEVAMEIEEEREVPVELALFPGCPDEDKMPKTSIVASPRRNVPVELNLFDLNNNNNDPWKIKKRLMASDIGHLSRLLLPTNLVKEHVLCFFGRGEVEMVESGSHVMDVVVHDFDTRNDFPLVFKRWTTSKSYVLNNGWIEHFVKRRSLKVGDEIGLYWNRDDSRLYFSVLNRAPENPMV